MKAEYTNLTFTPRTITISFESQKELDSFAALFNYTPVTDSVNFDVDELRNAACQAGASLTADFSRLTKAISKHQALDR
jgi:hypothetical protein